MALTKAQKESLRKNLAAAVEVAEASAEVGAAGSGIEPVPSNVLRPLALFMASLPLGRKVRIPSAFGLSAFLHSEKAPGYRVQRMLNAAHSAAENGSALPGMDVPPFLFVSDYSADASREAGEVRIVFGTRDSVPLKTVSRLKRNGIEPGSEYNEERLDDDAAIEVLGGFDDDEVKTYLAAVAEYKAAK